MGKAERRLQRGKSLHNLQNRRVHRIRTEGRTEAQNAYMSGVCHLAICALIYSNGKGRTADSTAIIKRMPLGRRYDRSKQQVSERKLIGSGQLHHLTAVVDWPTGKYTEPCLVPMLRYN